MLANNISFQGSGASLTEDVKYEERSNTRLAFDRFLEAEEMRDILESFESLESVVREEGGESVYEAVKSCTHHVQRMREDLWAVLERRRGREEYATQRASGKVVCVVGAGPAGLRAAIELALLGGEVHVLEKRPYFSRRNVMRLWPHSVEDCRSLAAKFFYRGFCSGPTHHIAIWRMQNIFTKIALLLGVRFHTGHAFVSVECDISTRGADREWIVGANPPLASELRIDALIGADGEKSTVADHFQFSRRCFQAKRAIGMTMNFVHSKKRRDSMVREFEIGRGSPATWPFFNGVKDASGMDLENMVYYRGETHYVVCTPSKASLLDQGVLKEDHKSLSDLLHPDNIDREKLAVAAEGIARAANIPCTLELNNRGEKDVQVFDFTKKLEAVEPSVLCRSQREQGVPLLVTLVGDALSGPFWPQGTGANKGIMSALDAAWMVCNWGVLDDAAYHKVVQRAFKCLRTLNAEGQVKFSKSTTIEPSSRYASFSRLRSIGGGASLPQMVASGDTWERVEHLIDTTA